MEKNLQDDDPDRAIKGTLKWLSEEIDALRAERSHDHYEDKDDRARAIESAYRRGVHQAISWIVNELNTSWITRANLEWLEDRAASLRFDGKKHPCYLDDLFAPLLRAQRLCGKNQSPRKLDEAPDLPPSLSSPPGH